MILPDIEIWQSFLLGNKSSLEQLLSLHYRSLYNYGSKYTRDTELIKDCIQELFLGLWQRRAKLNREVHPKAYLIASFRRLLHRKLQMENRFLKFKMSGDASAYFNFELSIEDKIIADESLRRQAEKITTLIATLPKRQKEVIYLKFYQNLCRDEIATVMGNNHQTVSNLLQLALKKLRNGLPPDALLLFCSLIIITIAL